MRTAALKNSYENGEVNRAKEISPKTNCENSLGLRCIANARAEHRSVPVSVDQIFGYPCRMTGNPETIKP